MVTITVFGDDIGDNGGKQHSIHNKCINFQLMEVDNDQ